MEKKLVVRITTLLTSGSTKPMVVTKFLTHCDGPPSDGHDRLHCD